MKLLRWVLRIALVGALGCAVIAARAVRGELRASRPFPHPVLRVTGDRWFDEARDVRVRTPKGAELRGWLRSSANGAAVVLVHGSAGDRAQLLPEAHILSNAGYGVLTFDRPGDGESGGQPYGTDEADFVRLAVDLLAMEPGVRPGGIGAYGFSSGAAYLADAAAADSRLHGVALAGCYTDADEFVLHFRNRGPLSGWPAVWTIWWEGFARPHPLVDVTQIAPRSLFFIVGDEDSVDPPAFSKRLYAAASEPKELWIVPGAVHGGYVGVAGAEYGRRLIAFFDRALLGREGDH